MIKIENLSKSFGEKKILQNASYHFPLQQRIALVGANGAGKSTLLNILCGLDHADSGQITIPNKVVVGYLPQEPNPNPQNTVLEECLSGAHALSKMKVQMDAYLNQLDVEYDENVFKKFEVLEAEYRHQGGYALESRSKGLLVGLGFSHAALEQNPKSLSGGWRMRLELAKLFLNDPDFLILDEPTNHLDLPSLVWVEQYLNSFEGTLLFVSHDRSLLNRLSTITLHLEGGKLNFYKGNFDSFLEQREKKQELDAATRERFLKRKQEIERFIEKFKAKASKAKQAQSRVKMLARMQDLEGDSDPETVIQKISFTLPVTQKSGREVFTAEGLSIGYHNPLFQDLNLKVFRGQKVAVIGANGIGKSTLLKTIAGHLAQLEGEFHLGHQVNLAYFAQDQLDIFNPKISILENILQFAPRIAERTARSLLGNFAFSGDDVHKPFQVLSGGEKSRVGLCSLLLQGANFIVLDEPTNHLDMSTAEILAQALDDYEGTALFVSHDRTFIDEVCTHVFVMTKDGKFAMFEGNIADYQRLAEVSGFPNILT